MNKQHRGTIEPGNFRFVKGRGRDRLTIHERCELEEDFGIEIDPLWAYVVAVLSQDEWDMVRESREED